MRVKVGNQLLLFAVPFCECLSFSGFVYSIHEKPTLGFYLFHSKIRKSQIMGLIFSWVLNLCPDKGPFCFTLLFWFYFYCCLPIWVTHCSKVEPFVLGIEHILCDYSFFGRLDASTLLCAKNLLWWHLYSYYDPFISLGFLFLFFSDCEYLFIY